MSANFWLPTDEHTSAVLRIRRITGEDSALFPARIGALHHSSRSVAISLRAAAGGVDDGRGEGFLIPSFLTAATERGLASGGKRTVLKTGERIHLQDPGHPGERVLHSGVVVERTAEGCSATFPEPSFAVEDGAEFIVYYELRRKFVQQLARIEAVTPETDDDDSRLVVSMIFEGDPGPAEGREHYRVTTISAPVSASLGDEEGCPVQDLSATGFALLSNSDYGIGTSLQTTIRYEQQHYSGVVCIQSIRQRSDGKMRYGLRFIHDGPGHSELEEGLHSISLAVQREQLRRQSGHG